VATIAEQRSLLASLLTGVGGLTVRAERPTQPRTGDGWVNVSRVVPGLSVTSCDCTLVAVLVLGSDERKAGELIATLSVPIVNAVTRGPLHPSDVGIEPATLPAGDSTPGDVYALILTLTVEVN
jgi:hypothetical protein